MTGGMLHTTLFETQIQQSIAKPGCCVANSSVIPARLCLVEQHDTYLENLHQDDFVTGRIRAYKPSMCDSVSQVGYGTSTGLKARI